MYPVLRPVNSFLSAFSCLIRLYRYRGLPGTNAIKEFLPLLFPTVVAVGYPVEPINLFPSYVYTRIWRKK